MAPMGTSDMPASLSASVSWYSCSNACLSASTSHVMVLASVCKSSTFFCISAALVNFSSVCVLTAAI
eukprot:9502520-Pyramimonas_sp.AAC.1